MWREEEDQEQSSRGSVTCQVQAEDRGLRSEGKDLKLYRVLSQKLQRKVFQEIRC